MPKQLTPEEAAALEKSRTISDAELLKGGAEYVVSEDGGKRLVATEQQKNISSIKSETILGITEHIGGSYTSKEIVVTKDMVKLFLEATGDINPIHFNEEEVEKSILLKPNSGEIIVPGFLILSLCANKDVLYQALSIDEPHEIIFRSLQDVKFISPVSSGSDITYTLKLEDAKKIGNKVITNLNIVVCTGKDKTPCMKASWSVVYSSLSENAN